MGNHEFNTDNIEGNSSKVDLYVRSILRKLFKVSNNDISYIVDVDTQLKGVDYIITTSNLDINVEIKTRFNVPPYSKYNDIGWEIMHTKDKSGINVIKKGWGLKENQLTHIIIYIFWDIKEAYVIDYIKVRSDVISNLEYFKSNYGMKPSYTMENGVVKYYTWNCFIPIEYLLNNDYIIRIYCGEKLNVKRFYRINE